MKNTTINIEEAIQTINKQNKRIEELCLEIERLNNTIKGLDNTIENLEEVIKHKDSIIKEVREYITYWHYRNDFRINSFTTGVKEELLEILKGE